MRDRGPFLCTLSLHDLRHYSSGRPLYLFFMVWRISRFLLQYSEPVYDVNYSKVWRQRQYLLYKTSQVMMSAAHIVDQLGHECPLPHGCIAPLVDCFQHDGLHRLRSCRLTHFFHQGTSPSSDIFFDRNENSPFLFSTLDIKLCQFPVVFCLSQIHIVGACPSFPLVSARYILVPDNVYSWRSFQFMAISWAEELVEINTKGPALKFVPWTECINTPP